MPDPILLLSMAIAGIAGGLLGRALHDWITAARELAAPEPEKLPPAVQSAIKGDCLVVAEWLRWNGWYLTDEALRLEAQAIHLQRQREHPGEPLDVNLVGVTIEMMKRHIELTGTDSRTLN